jgi:ubiquinone/menaquinone biosynthesis C-methylase UbiE
VYALPLKDSSFNAIICSEVIPLLPSLREMFAEFDRVLKKDGLLVLSFGNQKNRRRVFPFLRLAGMDIEAIDKTFPFEHHVEDVYSNMGDDFTVEEVDLFPNKYFTLNTIVVLRKRWRE